MHHAQPCVFERLTIFEIFRFVIFCEHVWGVLEKTARVGKHFRKGSRAEPTYEEVEYAQVSYITFFPFGADNHITC